MQASLESGNQYRSLYMNCKGQPTITKLQVSNFFIQLSYLHNQTDSRRRYNTYRFAILFMSIRNCECFQSCPLAASQQLLR